MVEVLCFLQELLEKGQTFSTIKVYLAAVLACRVGFGEKSPGKCPCWCVGLFRQRATGSKCAIVGFGTACRWTTILSPLRWWGSDFKLRLLCFWLLPLQSKWVTCFVTPSFLIAATRPRLTMSGSFYNSGVVYTSNSEILSEVRKII